MGVYKLFLLLFVVSFFTALAATGLRPSDCPKTSAVVVDRPVPAEQKSCQ